MVGTAKRRGETMEGGQRNVFGEPLEECGSDPATGFFRDGCCRASAEDPGRHLVCAEMTEEFLLFSKSRGNDLLTPRPEFGFPGLAAGDRWCLCAVRWKEAFEAGAAPPVFLRSTHAAALDVIPVSDLKKHAVDIS